MESGRLGKGVFFSHLPETNIVEALAHINIFYIYGFPYYQQGFQTMRRWFSWELDHQKGLTTRGLKEHNGRTSGGDCWSDSVYGSRQKDNRHESAKGSRIMQNPSDPPNPAPASVK